MPAIRPYRRPLPDRVAPSPPAATGHVGRAHVPMRHPQRVVAPGERRRVPHGAVPEGVARIDHRPHPGALVHALEPRRSPGPELSRAQPTRLLDVEHGDDVAGSEADHVEEVVGFDARIAAGEAGLRVVVGAHDEPVPSGTGDVACVPAVAVVVPERRPEDREAHGGRGDRSPVDPSLILGDVDARDLRPGDRRSCNSGYRHDCGRERGDEDDLFPASFNPPHGTSTPRITLRRPLRVAARYLHCGVVSGISSAGSGPSLKHPSGDARTATDLRAISSRMLPQGGGGGSPSGRWCGWVRGWTNRPGKVRNRRNPRAPAVSRGGRYAAAGNPVKSSGPGGRTPSR